MSVYDVPVTVAMAVVASPSNAFPRQVGQMLVAADAGWEIGIGQLQASELELQLALLGDRPRVIERFG